MRFSNSQDWFKKKYLVTIMNIRRGILLKDYRIERVDLVFVDKYMDGRRYIDFKYVGENRVERKRLSRVICEQIYKRRLLPLEEVHHKDNDKLNDRVSNLMVIPDKYHICLHSVRRSIKKDGSLKKDYKMLQCPKCMKVKVGPTWIPTKRDSRIHGTKFVLCNECSKRSYKRGLAKTRA